MTVEGANIASTFLARHVRRLDRHACLYLLIA